MIVYKVVHKNGNWRYFSTLHHIMTKFLMVEYKIGKVSSAPVGELFVFKCRECAKNFASIGDIVLRCTTDEKINKLTEVAVAQSPRVEFTESVKKFWEDKEGVMRSPAPRETYTVKSLTPLEVVE